MDCQAFVERLFETLITGSRPASRQLVAEARAAGLGPRDMISEVFWPTYELAERLFRADQLGTLSHHLATRLLRVLVDQNAAQLAPGAARRRSIFAICGAQDADDLGAQMAVDVLEAEGFEVTFAGGGVPSDEVLARVNEEQPDVLLMFASRPQDLPELRQLIDTLREIGATSSMQIAVGGGVFNRAEGLAEEIGADVWASTPLEMAERLVTEPERRAPATQRTVGRKRQQSRAA
ncbi:MAG TPA: cobalamin-dependent protein [Phycisphaerales bacterium]|nr:cobalamin-dependent protein [Phycisphaerales bacterium]